MEKSENHNAAKMNLPNLVKTNEEHGEGTELNEFSKTTKQQPAWFPYPRAAEQNETETVSCKMRKRVLKHCNRS
jgi:hypothetical protein